LKSLFRVSNNSNNNIINRIIRQVSLWINKNKAVQDLIVKDLFEDINFRNLKKLFTNYFFSKIILENNNSFSSKKLK
jgi:hypothetical protein